MGCGASADPKEAEKEGENGQPKKDLFPGGKAFEVGDANFDDDSEDPMVAAGAGGKGNYGKAPVKGQEKQIMEGDVMEEENGEGDLEEGQEKMEGVEGAEEGFEPIGEKGAEKVQTMKKVPPEMLIKKAPVKKKLQKMASKKTKKKQKSSKPGAKKSKSNSKKKNAKKSPSKKSSKSSKKKKKSSSKSNKQKKSTSSKKSANGKKKKSSSAKPAVGKTRKP